MKTAPYVSIASIIFLIILFFLKAILPALGAALLFFIAAVLLEGRLSLKAKFYPLSKVKKVVGKKHFLEKVVGIILLIILLTPLIGFNPALIGGFILFVYFFSLDSRSPFVIAVVFLAVTPFLLLINKTSWGEELAVIVYYFLIIGISWRLLEQVRAKVAVEPDVNSKNRQVTRWSEIVEERERTQVNFITLKLSAALIIVLAVVGIGYSLKGFKMGLPKVAWLNNSYSALTAPIPTVKLTPISVTTPTPEPTAELKLTEEFGELKVIIQNGTNIKGLAASTAAQLEAGGFKNVDIGNASSQDHSTYKISIQGEKGSLIPFIKDVLDLSVLEATNSAIVEGYDVLIIAGSKK